MDTFCTCSCVCGWVELFFVVLMVGGFERGMKRCSMGEWLVGEHIHIKCQLLKRSETNKIIMWNVEPICANLCVVPYETDKFARFRWQSCCGLLLAAHMIHNAPWYWGDMSLCRLWVVLYSNYDNNGDLATNCTNCERVGETIWKTKTQNVESKNLIGRYLVGMCWWWSIYCHLMMICDCGCGYNQLV